MKNQPNSMTDHLGNVRAVVGYDATGNNPILVRQKADYYPFGWKHQDSQISSGETYRYGYQGEFAEEDEETGWNQFELRMWDGRIGRWMTTDPANQFHSPYLGMGNNPVNGVDPDGAIWKPGAGFFNNLWANVSGFLGIGSKDQFVQPLKSKNNRLACPKPKVMRSPTLAGIGFVDKWKKKEYTEMWHLGEVQHITGADFELYETEDTILEGVLDPYPDPKQTEKYIKLAEKYSDIVLDHYSYYGDNQFIRVRGASVNTSLISLQADGQSRYDMVQEYGPGSELILYPKGDYSDYDIEVAKDLIELRIVQVHFVYEARARIRVVQPVRKHGFLGLRKSWGRPRYYY